MKPKNSSVLPAPPDHAQRIAALASDRSILVQAPAGSGKTDLLTRRYLRLLSEVDDPRQIVAITFTKAAAAEMRHRILAELEKAAARTADPSADESSLEALAARALDRSRKLNWRILELASQLRISTIDSFCRDLAIQQPISSGIGNSLQINERPGELYRRAARATLEKLGDPRHPELSDAIKDLLLWRDNGWKELEELLVNMLGLRDRWMLEFVLSLQQDWDALRDRLERPMADAVRGAIEELSGLLDRVPNAQEEAHELAQFACAHGGGEKHRELAELAEFPTGPYEDSQALDDARAAYICLGNLLLNEDGEFRRRINVRLGFPKEHADEKRQLEELIEDLSAVPGLGDALTAVRNLPPARYTEDDWQIVRASFILLRHAAGELKTVFAEAGTVDFVEVAQVAKHVLRGEDNLPSDAAIAVADDIRHLLVDEFQDTSRRQHEFISALIAAWPDRSGRTIFVVGDPMQSIYFFRDAEAELFARVRDRGFDCPGDDPLLLAPVRLEANFRTDPSLVSDLNDTFRAVFAEDDGSGIAFEKAEPARESSIGPKQRLQLHLEFVAKAQRGNSLDPDSREAARETQLAEIVAIIRNHLERMKTARAEGRKYRIAILGRARTALAPIAQALRDAGIPFRAIELETLKDQPEILDAVSLARALLNPEDRVAWLGVLRAPWCGLSLAELHTIAGTDDATQLAAPIPQLFSTRLHLLPDGTRKALQRVIEAFASVPHLRAKLPTASTGTVLQQLWRTLGGDRCVDAASRANLDLFWNLLDELPGGDQDLLGPALDAALADLCALPDPATSSDCGVQLMTIHKSKGLEFEVVIIPDLHARSGRNKTELLSWLERGIAEPEASDELTEFLIAPVQYKGKDPGKAKRWVERRRGEREAQEMRRILYVASTRAREELHLFAQPAYKKDKSGAPVLLEPSNCLLATAWPGLASQIRDRFDEWQLVSQASFAPIESVIPAIAAGANDNIIQMQARSKPTVLRRLPADFETSAAIDLALNSPGSVIGLGDADLYQRHEGGLLSRALGNAVHKLLEDFARLRIEHEWDEARAAVEQLRPRIVAIVRSTGISLAQAESITAQAFEIALKASRDPHGQWILSPHEEAAAESGWAGVVSGSLRLVRVDRIFRAGLQPRQPGRNALWVIDYKTAHSDNANPESVLRQFRTTFEPQLQTYAAVLRNLHGANTQLRAGLYYPRMSAFDWWAI